MADLVAGLVEPWVPDPIWEGQDVYVVGGGDSLRGFDWDLLAGRNVVGCNSAFVLGEEVCKVVVFGDSGWFDSIGVADAYDATKPLGPKNHPPLARFRGVVVGCSDDLWRRFARGGETKPSWLRMMKRSYLAGIATAPGELAWNGHTGSLALNLALALGARRVFLLGFDMKVGSGGKHNWHDVRHEDGGAGIYEIFANQFGAIAADLATKFPGREVVNVNDDSRLVVFENGTPTTRPVFHTVSIADHFAVEEVARG